MRRETGLALVIAIALAVAGGGLARAQAPNVGAGGGGMPNMRAISGKPLPDRGMPPGTVTVRVGRKSPANAVADLEVTAIIRNAGGDLRKRTAKTDSSGRAIFEGIATDQQFQAEVVVDGERLKTDAFPMPADGGVRTMLIAGLGPPGADEAPAAAAPGAGAGGEANFTLGATAGAATPDATLPAKTLIVRLSDEAGRPLANHPVILGAVDKSSQMKVRRATSDAAGEVKFTDLPTGQDFGYAAVIDHGGTRLSTEPFAMPDQGGMRATIRVLGRTSDQSVITIGQGARVILQLRNDNLSFIEILPLENKSDKTFDPGPGAVEIPLPKGHVAGEVAPTDRKTEVRKDHGIAVYGPITPRQALGQMDAKAAGNEITLGFVLPYSGDSRDFVQQFPSGIGAFTLITEQVAGLTITGTGIGAREGRELGGRKYWVMPVEPIGVGQALRFTVHGLPSTDRTGRTVSGVLTLLLILGAIVLARRPSEVVKKTTDERQRLTTRRESLFSELVTLEQTGRKIEDPNLAQRRNLLVTKLEGVYQELAALDEQRAL